MSAYDIDQGEHWDLKLTSVLSDSNFGIVCLTPENLNNPWVLYEAGAISKSLKSRTWILLFNLKSSDITGPLSRFQLTNVNEDSVFQMMQSINRLLGDDKLDDDRLHKQFNKWWPELITGLNRIGHTPQVAEKRNDREILEELLDLIRDQSRIISEVRSLQKGSEFKEVKKSLSNSKDEAKELRQKHEIISAGAAADDGPPVGWPMDHGPRS